MVSGPKIIPWRESKHKFFTKSMTNKLLMHLTDVYFPRKKNKKITSPFSSMTTQISPSMKKVNCFSRIAASPPPDPPRGIVWGDADCLWNYKKVGPPGRCGMMEGWNDGRERSKTCPCAEDAFWWDFSNVVEIVVEMEMYIYIYTLQLATYLVTTSSNVLVPCSPRWTFCFGEFWMVLCWVAMLRWDAIIHGIAQDVAKETSPWISVSEKTWLLVQRVGINWINLTKKEDALIHAAMAAARRGRWRRKILHSPKPTWHLKIGHPQRKLVFQASKFRGYVSFREGISLEHFWFPSTNFWLVWLQTLLLTSLGHMRCCKLRKVPLPYLGFNLIWVVVSNIYWIFIPKIGEMIQFDDHIFWERLKTPTSDFFFFGGGTFQTPQGDTHLEVTCFFPWMESFQDILSRLTTLSYTPWNLGVISTKSGSSCLMFVNLV